ncbi:hypothetical protein TPHA_0B04530 [Tetrapisispora phaffii CBS 4417]|uniref:SUN-like protein 1 n=1 Tax=Tetrapisispora phaffii (strain ATCC 24235 / CBS 4417 / NBRC 1672 / NRRL Y-8282 / UCD 70-5) TaxID=1071381 RepID=G8BQ41_TETPH|nr:hypothetical protein TPHA_0B04530 [Tetrapisispora phaffii CBS 4417]CCE62122.1 hypothetical protein TPHA_0B04530 [Tetrapisispora phaffii CBS 4417]
MAYFSYTLAIFLVIFNEFFYVQGSNASASLIENNVNSSCCIEKNHRQEIFKIEAEILSCVASLTKSAGIEASTKYALSSTVFMPVLSTVAVDIALELTDDKSEKEASNITNTIDLKNNTFKPFNEWKQQKLYNTLSDSKIRAQRTRSPVNQDLEEQDLIGGEMEIDLGFFTEKEIDNELPEVKVYKNKFNYASLDCAATIMETNSDASGANSILIENKDTYLLNPCSVASKYVIIELCQDILVEQIAMANFEFFSSTFKDVRFSVSDRYPITKDEWKVIGNFKAQNSRNIQNFMIENPKIWARYLKIETISFFDNEYYCPISVVRVHGKTMMDEYKMSNIDKHDREGIEYKYSEAVEDDEIEMVCDPINEISGHNFTNVMFMNNRLNFTESALQPLTFDDYLKEVNRTFCPPRPYKNSSATSSLSSSGSTEDSIFKNIMKRLTSLESNTNLTFSYIEEQSRLLSESFEASERSHVKKLTFIIDAFNITVQRNIQSLSEFAGQLKEQSLRILEEQKLNNDFFSTQNARKMERMEKEIAYQRRVIYFILFVLSALVLATILNKEFYFDDYNQPDNWMESKPKPTENKSYSKNDFMMKIDAQKKEQFTLSPYSSGSAYSDIEYLQNSFDNGNESDSKLNTNSNFINEEISNLKFTKSETFEKSNSSDFNNDTENHLTFSKSDAFENSFDRKYNNQHGNTLTLSKSDTYGDNFRSDDQGSINSDQEWEY